MSSPNPAAPPAAPSSKAVLYPFLIVAALTLVIGLIVAFRSGSTSSHPSPATNAPAVSPAAPER